MWEIAIPMKERMRNWSCSLKIFVLWLTEEEMSLKHITGVSTKIKESTNIQTLTFRNRLYSKMALCSQPSHLAQSTGTRAAPI